MQVLVTYGGDPIPKSPFTVGVAAPLDLSRIKINGLENSKYVRSGGGDGSLKSSQSPFKDNSQRSKFCHMRLQSSKLTIELGPCCGVAL